MLYKGLKYLNKTANNGCTCTFASPFTEEFEVTFDPDTVTYSQILAWMGGEYIQDAMPNASASIRDMFITGMPEDYYDELQG